MLYSDLFDKDPQGNSKFWSAIDSLMEKLTDFKTILRITKLKDSIASQAKALDDTRNDLMKKARNEKTKPTDRENFVKQINEMGEEEITVEKITIDGIEEMKLNGIVIEQIDKIVDLSGVGEKKAPVKKK